MKRKLACDVAGFRPPGVCLHYSPGFYNGREGDKVVDLLVTLLCQTVEEYVIVHDGGESSRIRMS